MTAPTDHRAQTESLASLLLIAVVVVSATTFGAYYVASTTGGAGGGAAGGAGGAVGAEVDVSIAATERQLTLSHNGGATLSTADLRVTVENASGEYDFGFENGTVRGGDADGRFEPGETWALDWTQSAGSEVTVTLVDASSGIVVSRSLTVESSTTSDGDGSAEGAGAGELTIAVDAGDDRRVSGEAGSAVGLNGSVPDSADNLAYEWRVVDDDGLSPDAIEITNAETLDPTFEVRENVTDRNRTVTVEFTAENGTASGRDSVSVTVEAINRPPVADAGEDRTWDGDDEDRDGSEDGRGPPDDKPGPPEESEKDGSNSIRAPGSAVVRPAVTIDSAPVFADSDGGDVDLDDPYVELNGSGSFDPDGDDLQYDWQVVDRGDFQSDELDLVDADSTKPKLVLLALPEEEYRNVTVELTVTDTSDATDSDRVNVTAVPTDEFEREDIGPPWIPDFLEKLFERFLGDRPDQNDGPSDGPEDEDSIFGSLLRLLE
ncbi:PKD domain-containing protein [Halobellus clavatus]|uniref:Uncharacterized protein n=1 Tax=Halobellus clavatus TaxID=660517 RepID=A0A1H3JPW1_9EURY|nr:hypothetical protein [Halobellus clavatus]SDY41304.1 hypothetical protein SAMN04487946_11472 [Halobellus clavatus]